MSEQKGKLQARFLNAARELADVWPELFDVENSEHPTRDPEDVFLTRNRRAKALAELADKYMRRRQ